MEIIKTDVLVIGGGIAGCFAAIRASELGRSVVLLDKATIRRGGSTAAGMASLMMGIGPGLKTLEEAKEDALHAQNELTDPNVLLTIEKGEYQRALDLDRFGVKVREDDGSLYICRNPARHRAHILIRGIDVKVKLAEAVRQTNTKVIERTMGVDLLTHNGAVVGAIALNVRDGKVTTFLLKATILCTGDAGRQYIAPDGHFLTWYSPTSTGDSEAMAYRAGAKLANMEYIWMDYVQVRCGGGIIDIPYDKMPILVNRNGEKVLKTEEESLQRGFLMVKEIAEGRGPLYWDFRKVPEEMLERVERKMSNEFPITKEWLTLMGLDIRKTLIPIQLVPACVEGGPIVDKTFKTSMEGLYAAGDTTAYLTSLMGAAASGHIAAESAAKYASEIEEPLFEEEKAENIVEQTIAPLKRYGGTNPIALEEAIQHINTDYVGYFKAEGMMQAGLEKLLELKNAYLSSLYARNPHELMHCMEVRNIFDVSEMHIRASLMRKESRIGHAGIIPHYRADYPKTDPAWEKLVVIKKEDGEMKLSTQEIPELEEE